MTIRRLFIRRTAISLAAIAVGVIALLLTAQKPARFMQRSHSTGKLIRLLGSQIVFSGEYASSQSERPLRQWHFADQQIENTLSEIQRTIRTPEERQALSAARWHYARAEYLFDQLRKTVETRHPPESLVPARAQVLIDELSERLESVVGQAYGLNQMMATRLDRESRHARWIIEAVFATVIFIVIGNFVMVGRRLIGPLGRLHHGVRALSQGEFSHVVAVDRSDEIGDLARSFNEMARDLAKSYSRLENELDDRRKAQEALHETSHSLRLALESAQMGVWTWDIPTDQLEIDEHIARLAGWHMNKFSGRLEDAFKMVHGEDRERVKHELAHALSGAIDLETTFRVFQPHGLARVICVRGSVQRDETGAPNSLSGVAWDITEKRLVEERLVASQHALKRAYEDLEEMVEERTRALVRKTSELERSNADLEQFAYVASHDLQEPLRKIASYGELLQERYGKKLDERGRRYANYMVDGVRRLQELIHALLSYARVNRQTEAFAPVPLDDVFDRLLLDMDVAIKDARATIRHEALPNVFGNEMQIKQVLQNLVSNALKFRGHRPVEIEISAERSQNEWLIRLRDNGIGIDPEYQEKIFVVFQRLHSRDQYPGTGIGLAICKKIVERHGGRIWVESVPGEGSTFCFTLPAVPAAVTETGEPTGKTAGLPANKEGAAA